MKMRFFLLLTTIAFLSNQGISQIKHEPYTLSGYFIVTSFDTSMRSGCDLNIATTSSIYGDSMICGDGNFYKNVSTIDYLNPEDVDIDQIDDLMYYAKLQNKQCVTYLSINPLILLEVSNADSSILNDSTIVECIKNNQHTAELFQEQIELLDLNFKKSNMYAILMKGSFRVLDLNKRKKVEGFKAPHGLDQHLILHDKANKLKAVKIIISF